MARMRTIKPELDALYKGELFAYFCHSGGVGAKLDSLAQEPDFVIFVGGQGGMGKDLLNASKSDRTGKLPSYCFASTSNGERSTIALLYFFQKLVLAAMHSYAHSGANVMHRPTLARYVDAPLSHEEADEFIVKGVKFHNHNHTAAED